MLSFSSIRPAIRLALALVLMAGLTACGSAAPDTDSLRESFAMQVAANSFVTDFARDGDELTFTGPGPEGGTAEWRVRIDSAVVEANTDDPEQHPFKGTVRSSWFADGRQIEPSGSESNLPFELISNGVSQDCWALWDTEAERWGWE
jgi:hypothetical protein